MGIRLLFLVIVIVLVLWLLRRLFPARKTPRREVSARMVRCARCGLHVPEHEALQAGGKHYCCSAHRDADQGD